MFRICAVVPVYNHERAVGAIVNRLRQHELPVYLVDDGSSDACAQTLNRLAAEDESVRLIRLPRNQGKGAAVTAGFVAAAADGYSHALQIDADGQHDTGDVPRFLAEASGFPDAVICGQPEFDESIPSHRRYPRYLTHAMVWLNTLSFDIPDSMCGMRVYPLSRMLHLLSDHPAGRRMDFDVEILVRAHWQGIPMRWLSTRVTYPSDGVSHFRLVRDNWLITLMHARLFCGMLARLPQLVERKMRAGAGSAQVAN
jgi:glycosyltransferase involved in cell wall biosynthesis